jgi:excisionase family DNA binding protein
MRKRTEDISLISQNHSTPEGLGSANCFVPDEADDRLLRVDEAAKMLGLSVGGLYHLVSQRRIHVVRISSRCIRFSQRALREWVESLTQKAEGFPED